MRKLDIIAPMIQPTNRKGWALDIIGNGEAMRDPLNKRRLACANISHQHNHLTTA